MPAIRCSSERRAAVAARSAGFTILEILVVLVIVGMVSVSLFEALSRLNDVRGRLSPFLSTSEREGLVNLWFRNAVNDIVPDADLGKNVFKGSATSFSGLTLAPLAGDPGGPSVFKWDLTYDAAHDRTALHYTGYDGNPLELRVWQGDKTRFAYLGGEKDPTWYETWPPGLQKTKQLPLAIRLYSVEEKMVIVAAIRGAKEPPPDPTKLFTGQ
jgi:prepilin-type N-terminal cleavage/methylation domain-containing protein